MTTPNALRRARREEIGFIIVGVLILLVGLAALVSGVARDYAWSAALPVLGAGVVFVAVYWWLMTETAYEHRRHARHGHAPHGPAYGKTQ